MTAFKISALVLFSALMSPNLKADPIDSGPYLVFFAWDASTLSGESKQTLDSVIRAYQTNGDRLNWTVQLAGFADRSGQFRYNKSLADRRLASVRTYLASRGIKADRFELKSFGESEANLREGTADGVRSSQNRRVEIYFQPHLPAVK